MLQQPTRNSLGAYGNDLPALYLFDQNLGVETMMYFDFSDMGWMSLQNLPRFLVYRCSSVSMVEPDGNQKLGVGLVADQLTGNVLPAGEIRFTYYLLQRSLDRLLTEQEAATRWISALLPLFTEKLDWPGVLHFLERNRRRNRPRHPEQGYLADRSSRADRTALLCQRHVQAVAADSQQF